MHHLNHLSRAFFGIVSEKNSDLVTKGRAQEALVEENGDKHHLD
jgi:hypothetical protein